MVPAPRLHHYVPAFIIRNFRGDAGLVNYFDKARPGDGVVLRNPNKILAVKRLYTRIAPDRTKDTSLEADYGRLEALAAPILEMMVQCAQQQGVFKLTGEQRAVITQFLYNQIKRCPEWFRKYASPDFFEEHRNRTIAEWVANGNVIRPEDELWLNDSEELERLHQEIKVRALSYQGLETLDGFNRLSISLLMPNRASSSFLLGSVPVLLSVNGTNAGGFMLPVAHNAAITLGVGDDRKAYSCNSTQLRQWNMKTFSQSEKVVSRSGVLIESVAKAHGFTV